MRTSFLDRVHGRELAIVLLVLLSACKASSPSDKPSDSSETEAATGSAVAESASAELRGADGPDVAQPAVPRGNVVFNAVSDADQKGTHVEAALRNGEPVPLDSLDWQASFITEFDGDNGKESCTSAMIGPGVMLTAAHCIPDSLKVEFAFNGARYPMACARHPLWESGADASADYGLCVISDPRKVFTPPPTFLYERVDVSAMAKLAQVRAPIILTGYGCISNEVAQKRIDGRYRIGKNVVIATSDSGSPRPAYPDLYFGPNGQRNNLFTSDTGANICPGDSGGPAFSAGATGASARRIIAVNSRVFFDPQNRARYGASLLAATGSADFGPWARKWLTDRHLAACGLAGTPQKCRP